MPRLRLLCCVLLATTVLGGAQCTDRMREAERPRPVMEAAALGEDVVIRLEGCEITVGDVALTAVRPVRGADGQLTSLATTLAPEIRVRGERPVSVTATADRTVRLARAGDDQAFQAGRYGDQTATVPLADKTPTRAPADEPIDCRLLPRLVFTGTDWDAATDAAITAGIAAGRQPSPDTLLVDIETALTFEAQSVVVRYTRAAQVIVNSATGSLSIRPDPRHGILNDSMGGTTPTVDGP